MRAFLAVLFFCAAIPAYAHMKYPILCCNGTDQGGDCAPVPCEEIAEADDGGARWHGYTFRKEQVHPSFDRQCHACVGHYGGAAGDVPHCVFIQPSS